MRMSKHPWRMLLLLALGVGLPWLSLHAAVEGTTRKIALIAFGLPSSGPEREWLAEGLPQVVALRLQHLPQVKVTVLSQAMLPSAGPAPHPTEAADIAKTLERLRAQGYEVVVFGNLLQVEPTLRADIQAWTVRAEPQVSKTQEQAAERDPDSLGIKIASFIMSVLQSPVTEADGRRVVERYTASAEAFERFARALTVAATADDDEDMLQAVSLFREALKLDGKFAMAWRQQGDVLFRRGHFAPAAEAYQAVIALGRRTAPVYRLLGNAYFAQRDTPRAIDAYKRGLQLDARDASLLLDLGLAYAVQRDYENATKTFLRALEFKPNDPLAFANLGVVYLLQANFPAATASLRRAQQLHSTDPTLSYNLGLSLLFEGAYEQARDQFERALQLRPDYPAAAYQLALLYERFDVIQAADRWRKYLDLARGQPGEQPWVAWAERHLQSLQ
jgi:tetratricopeptide (TPR) repeat protein